MYEPCTASELQPFFMKFSALQTKYFESELHAWKIYT